MTLLELHLFGVERMTVTMLRIKARNQACWRGMQHKDTFHSGFLRYAIDNPNA